MFLFGKKKKEEDLKTRALSGDAEAQYDYAQSLLGGGALDDALRFYGMAAKQGHGAAAEFLRAWYLSDVLNELTMGDLETMKPQEHIGDLLEACEQVNAADPSEENERLYGYCIRLRDTLASNLSGAKAGDGAALYALAAILTDDVAEEACAIAELDGPADAAREFAEQALDAGYAPAADLLQKLL